MGRILEHVRQFLALERSNQLQLSYQDSLNFALSEFKKDNFMRSVYSNEHIHFPNVSGTTKDQSANNNKDESNNRKRPATDTQNHDSQRTSRNVAQSDVLATPSKDSHEKNDDVPKTPMSATKSASPSNVNTPQSASKQASFSSEVNHTLVNVSFLAVALGIAVFLFRK